MLSNNSNIKEQVKMIGLDFGSTTSSAMIATAGVGLNSVTGRMAFSDPDIIFRSDVEFTPFKGDQIDPEAVAALLDAWLEEAQDLFSGGVIITGLAALQKNAAHIARLVKERIGQAVIATVDDPNLESWLAFMGCAATLSRHHKERTLVNLDIGGGTTNPAAGREGQVKTTGCFYVGARHLRFEPGTYRLVSVSEYGRAVLAHIGIHRSVGDILEPAGIDALVDFYLEALKAMALGDTRFFDRGIGSRLCQSSFSLPAGDLEPLITFSGGVGELIYRMAAGEPPPGTTFYGDLGVDLARGIMADPCFSKHIDMLRPENMGRATVYGLTLHNTEISGSTLFLPDPGGLPLNDVPIVARLKMDCGMEEIIRAMSVVGCRGGRACIQIVPDDSTTKNCAPVMPAFEQIKALGHKIAQALETMSKDIPLVILAPGNFGKALGNYATNWGKAGHNLMIIDEIPDRNAQFVNIGSPHRCIVPVSFYGIY